MNTKQNVGKLGAVKWPVLLTAGALAVAPLLNPVAVQAAPYRANNSNITISGVVTSDLAGNQFNLRGDDGRTYRVVTNRKEPGWLTNGDRVEVRGRLTNSRQNLIVASSVAHPGGIGGASIGANQNITVSGVVASDLEGNEFNMRANDGHIYRVVTTRTEPGWLSNGDRVTVQGRINKAHENRIIASNVTTPGGASGAGNIGGGFGQTVTVRGVVTRDPVGNQFTLRSDDGRTYRVIAKNREPGWVTNGDRVTVQGQVDKRDRTLILADNVMHSNGVGGVGAGGLGAGLAITVNGVVTRDPAGNQFTIRSDDGRTYRVITNNQEPGWLTNGDRVTVRGKLDNRDRTFIIATSVTQQGGASSKGGSLSVNLSGVVTRDPVGNQFTLRADDGRTYRIITNNQEPGWLTTGDHVTVRGQRDARDRDLVIATSVSHPNGANGNGIGQGVAMQGVVTRDRSGNQFTFRSDDGRTYRVVTTNREPGWLTTGDRVVVRGRQDARDRDLIIATSVDHPNGTVGGATYGRNSSTNSAVNFLGSVVSVSNKGLIRNLSVRGDNGVVYAVTYRNLQTFRVGDRVQVIGTFSNGRVNASSVSAR